MESSLLVRRAPAATGQLYEAKPTSMVLSEDQRILIQEALSTPIAFVPHPIFDQADAESKLFNQGPQIPEANIGWYHPMVDDDLVTATTGEASVLTAEQEQQLFLRFNYARKRAAETARRFRLSPSRKTGSELAFWWARVREARDLITGANLALVLAMAKRTRMSEVEFGELVSEGNMAMLRAVEKFDISRGFKFSTYACRAILKSFSRAAMRISRHRSLFPTEFDPLREIGDDREEREMAAQQEALADLQAVLTENRANLSQVERRVLDARFAMAPTSEATSDLTLEEVGQVMGVTKERIRQIQNRAIQKLRTALRNKMREG